MTVNDLVKSGHFTTLSLPDGERTIDGIYIGDLLSWVMGRAKSDNAWITIMSNINVIAVASLSDTSCVILAEGVTLDDEIRRTAEEKDVNIISSPLPAFETAKLLMELAL